MDPVKVFAWVGMCAFAAVTNAQAGGSQEDRSGRYRARYQLADTSAKRVDNRGDGYEDLYGTRNFRAVLPGVLYRGGANNAYHRDHPRANQNPLPNDGLKNLCDEGFDNAIYLYAENFNTAPKDTTCAPGRSLHYQSWSPSSDDGLKSALRLIHATILDPSRGPVYAHCWNGWHASGLLSAISLRQFCGVSAEDAVKYWDRNTDGTADSSMESIRRRIRNYQPDPALSIPEDSRQVICPNYNGELAD